LTQSPKVETAQVSEYPTGNKKPEESPIEQNIDILDQEEESKHDSEPPDDIGEFCDEDIPSKHPNPRSPTPQIEQIETQEDEYSDQKLYEQTPSIRIKLNN